MITIVAAKTGGCRRLPLAPEQQPFALKQQNEE
jgi:hypothetical protein